MTASIAMRRFVLINPNTDPAVTASMVAIANADAPAGAAFTGATAGFGSPLIVDPEALSIAAVAVLELVPTLGACDGVIVSAFGDPGLRQARQRLRCPVTGLAEASMASAAAAGRRFCVVTTTPALAPTITAAAHAYGHHGDAYAGTFCTPDDPLPLMRDERRLREALLRACEAAVHRHGVDAVIIGGGPLAMAARAIAGLVGVPLIEPIRAAVHMLAQAETP